jgi:gamma-glutamylcyclotransferase (GGCT)/AIG2-like uncharacterized protein YtfP
MSRVDNYTKYLPVFAYGILKYPRNIVQEGGINIVEGAKVEGHRLYSMNGNGIALATPFGATHEDAVIGTYFEVPDWIVEIEYDFVEGYTVSGPEENNMYNRRMVEVTLLNGEKKQANMYIANLLWFHRHFIPEFHIKSGNNEDKYLLGQKLDSK